MKRSVFTLFLCVAAVAGYSQCKNYYNIKEGSVFEMETYNPKDKKEGRILNKVSSYTENGGGFEAVIQSTIFDKKDQQAQQGEYKMLCNGGVLQIDIKKFIPEEMLKSFEGAEVEVTGDLLEMPASLAVGQSLKDGSLQLKMASGQGIGMSMDVAIRNRKVEAKEAIVTPAGEFECYKISYDINAKTSMMGMNINNSMKAVEWVSLGKGVVKSSTYNTKGSLVGYSLLTRFEQ